MTAQNCPICGTAVQPNPRYTKYVCSNCAKKASDINGRKLVFYNQDFSGGYIAYYADGESKEEYKSHDCYIDGIQCWADEARFGGIVIEVVEMT
ncbi:hypothetical protein F7734_10360 [Scytonema sp. UIC 10036]|uniref:hypothetical protein n=1 Tax=Scytonema sp. UIC 10036 TaxID=2304196 RepID=UPI0012DA021E|nr:hypothetical protein [Scytonema sp. UIC 10036]MUG92828.1 hypothetical protein [Scytonema sp. UIC 10036]